MLISIYKKAVMLPHRWFGLVGRGDRLLGYRRGELWLLRSRRRGRRSRVVRWQRDSDFGSRLMACQHVSMRIFCCLFSLS